MGEGGHIQGQEIYGTSLYLLLNCCEPKAVKKIIKPIKKEKNGSV